MRKGRNRQINKNHFCTHCTVFGKKKRHLDASLLLTPLLRGGAFFLTLLFLIVFLHSYTKPWQNEWMPLYSFTNTPSVPLQFYTHPVGFVRRGPCHPHRHDSVSAHRPACSRAKHLSCLQPASRCLRESVWGQMRGKKARWVFFFSPKVFSLPCPPSNINYSVWPSYNWEKNNANTNPPKTKRKIHKCIHSSAGIRFHRNKREIPTWRAVDDGEEGGWWGGVHYISAREEKHLACNKAFNQERLRCCHILFGVKGSNRNQREIPNEHAKPWFHLHTEIEIMHSITCILNLCMYVCIL